MGVSDFGGKQWKKHEKHDKLTPTSPLVPSCIPLFLPLSPTQLGDPPRIAVEPDWPLLSHFDGTRLGCLHFICPTSLSGSREVLR